jgi:hypothetical protein
MSKQEGFWEFLGLVSVEAVLNSLTNVNRAGNSIKDVPKGSYTVAACFDENKKFLKLELKPE